MKPIRVIDKDLNLLAEIDNYEALIFTRSYHKYGSFELHINVNKKDTDKLQKDNLIIIGNDTKKVGIIRHRELKLDESGKQSEALVVKGFELKSVLGRRFTVPPTGKAYDYINNNAETVLKHYVEVNAINPTSINRKIENLVITENLNRGEQIKYQSRFKQLDSELEKISLVSGLGWTVYLDIQNKKWVFDVLEGKDLTSSQTNNPPVIFSVDFDNIKGQHFIDSELNYKNVAYVGGQGQGENREIVEINSEKTSLDRIETFIDARDISVQEDLVDRGLQKLKELEPLQSFTSKVLTYGPFKYQEDWDIGDIVTVHNKKWNITLDSRITEVREIYEPDGFSIEVIFGNNVPTIIDKIKQELDKPLVETGEVGEITWSSIPDKPTVYPPEQHDHNDLYYTEAEINALLGNKSDLGHIHDDRYYTETEINNLLANYALSNHNHDVRYALKDHTHEGLSIEGHTHDDRYYTESEINSLLSSKANLSGASFTGNITFAGTNGIRNRENQGFAYIPLKRGWATEATIPDSFPDYSHSLCFVESSGSGFGIYGCYETIKMYNNNAGVQFFYPYNFSGGADEPIRYRVATYNGSDWYAWRSIASREWVSANYASSSHNHDSRYYTESEVNSLLSNKSDVGHTHSYLPLSGGTLSGNIIIPSASIKAGGRTYQFIHAQENTYGVGLIIGKAGSNISIVAGEGYTTHSSRWLGDSENVYLAGNNVYFEAGTETSSYNHASFRSDGRFYIGSTKQPKVTVSSTAPSSKQIGDIWVDTNS